MAINKVKEHRLYVVLEFSTRLYLTDDRVHKLSFELLNYFRGNDIHLNNRLCVLCGRVDGWIFDVTTSQLVSLCAELYTIKRIHDRMLFWNIVIAYVDYVITR